jgi:preprotein translocase subunit Sss1
MGTAIQIEMALDQAKRFEDELQLLFMQSGKIDVWNKIKSRAAALDVESAHDARRVREAANKRKREMDEVVEIVLIALVLFAILGVIGYFTIGILEQQR